MIGRFMIISVHSNIEQHWKNNFQHQYWLHSTHIAIAYWLNSWQTFISIQVLLSIINYRTKQKKRKKNPKHINSFTKLQIRRHNRKPYGRFINPNNDWGGWKYKQILKILFYFFFRLLLNKKKKTNKRKKVRQTPIMKII